LLSLAVATSGVLDFVSLLLALVLAVRSTDALIALLIRLVEVGLAPLVEASFLAVFLAAGFLATVEGVDFAPDFFAAAVFVVAVRVGDFFRADLAAEVVSGVLAFRGDRVVEVFAGLLVLDLADVVARLVDLEGLVAAFKEMARITWSWFVG